MSLQDTLNEDLKQAMRSGDDVRKRTLRSIKAAITRADQERMATAIARISRSGLTPEAYEALIAEKTRELPPFADADVVSVLRKEAKQREDSIEAYAKAGRADLVAEEQAEMAVIQGYLPQQMDEESIRVVVQAVIGETGASGPKDMGKVMPRVMAQLAGRAEGRLVNKVVREQLGS